MRRIALILLFVGCVATNGTALTSGANPALQQNSETSASLSAARPRNSEQAASSNQSGGRKEAIRASDDRGRSRHLSRKIHLPTPARSNKANRPTQVQHKRTRSENLTGVQQPNSIKPAVGAVRGINTRTPPLRPTSGAAIDGRQFRAGRNVAATQAALGGPAKARNTQVLSGTGVTRRR
jgi:hypothetical protein